MPRGRPRKFIGPLTKSAQARKDHKKITKIAKMIAPAKKHVTSSFPDSMRAKQSYFEMISSNGVAYGFSYRTNSTYNPRVAAGGHQPNGRDLMVQAYSKYKVHGITATVKFVAAVAVAYIACIGVTNNVSTPESDIIKLIETPGFKYKATSVNGGDVTLKLKCKNHELAGVSELNYSDDSVYSADVNSNPAEVMALGVYFTKVDGTLLTSGDIWAEVRITYDVTYYDPIIFTIS